MKTLIENNKLIAEFMGVQLFFGEPYNKDIEQWEVFFDTLYETKDLAYHTDWNWLIKVVVKILDISLELDTMELYYNITDSIPNIKETHKKVIEFINWYNNKQ
jgi:hypothetical protein